MVKNKHILMRTIKLGLVVAASYVRPMAALTLAPVPCGSLACQKDTYLKSLTATVVSCELAPPTADAAKGKKKKGKQAPAAAVYEVVLSDTVLFPEGGGQPSDTGTVGGAAATRVDNVGGVAVHSLSAPLEVGAAVRVELDWGRRWDHACQHSAQHLITARAAAMNGSPTLSWSLAADGACSLELGLPFDAAADLAPLEADVNEAILADHAVSAEWHSVADVNGNRVPGLRPSSKALPDHVTGPIRVVRMDGVDVNPCCGTHVTSTAHLRGVKFVRAERKKASTLVSFAAGSVGINHWEDGRPGISSNPSILLKSNSFPMILEPLILASRVLDD